MVMLLVTLQVRLCVLHPSSSTTSPASLSLPLPQVVRVVLQEGMPASQQLRVYVSALLAALQERHALPPPAQVRRVRTLLGKKHCIAKGGKGSTRSSLRLSEYYWHA
jgi:hypothetical protein